MHSIVANKGGHSPNDLYVALYDNRNGTIRNSNNDVFFYKSTDGGRPGSDPRASTTTGRIRPRIVTAVGAQQRLRLGTGAASCPAAGTGTISGSPGSRSTPTGTSM